MEKINAANKSVSPCPLCGAGKKDITLCATDARTWTRCEHCGFQVSDPNDWNAAAYAIKSKEK